MSVSGIQNSAYIPQIRQTGGVNQTGAVDGDGDSDGSGGGRSGTSLTSAIGQTLSQTTGSNGISSSSQQALQAFIQSLFAALQAQTTQASTGMDADGGSISPVAAASGRGNGGMSAGLQGLIQQLSSSGAPNSADAALQQSFQNLLGAQGNGNQTSLASFLQALSQNLQGAGTAGSVVNTQG